MTDQTHIHHVDSADLESYRPRFIDLYRKVYAEPPYFETEEHVADYIERFADEQARAGFALVVAEAGIDLVGYVYGHSFPADEWWQEADQEPVTVRGRTKFAVMELAVRRPYRGRGVGTALMKNLLDGRPEELATLCSNPAAPARQIYQRWGWRHVACAYPPGIPPMDVLILPFHDREADLSAVPG